MVIIRVLCMMRYNPKVTRPVLTAKHDTCKKIKCKSKHCLLISHKTLLNTHTYTYNTHSPQTHNKTIIHELIYLLNQHDQNLKALSKQFNFDILLTNTTHKLEQL